MKKPSVIFLFIIWYTGLFGQQEPQFNQYMINRVSINPAVAGASGAACITGIARDQWMGYKNDTGTTVNPFTYGLSFDMPLYSIKSGAGLTFQYNKTGAEKNIDVRLLYAYHYAIKKKQTLSFGFSFGLLSKSIDYSKVTPSEDDPLLQGNSAESGLLTNIGLGIHYQAFNKFYAGISATNLLGSSTKIGEPEFTMARHYYLFSGYDIELSKSKHNLVLTPGFLVKATSGAVNADLNAILTYNDFIWGGVFYRIQDAVGIMAGFNYNGLKLGVSYDYTMNSTFAQGSRNSVEFFIKYCYPLHPPVIMKSGYNPRNL